MLMFSKPYCEEIGNKWMQGDVNNWHLYRVVFSSCIYCTCFLFPNIDNKVTKYKLDVKFLFLAIVAFSPPVIWAISLIFRNFITSHCKLSVHLTVKPGNNWFVHLDLSGGRTKTSCLVFLPFQLILKWEGTAGSLLQHKKILHLP